MNTSTCGISSQLQSFVDRGILAGAVVAISDRRQIRVLEAVGYSDLAAKKAAKKDDLYWIASMTKPMTGAALMMLVEEGKVSTNDPVECYLPEFKGMKVKEENGALRMPSHSITIKNVLSHSAGLSFSSTKENEIGKLDQLPLKEAILSYAADPLLRDPDLKYQYANEGTNIGGRIIEVVSGMPYEKFMQERLFTPLGMSDTTFWPEGEKLSRVAKVYQTNATKTALEETLVTQLTYPLDDRKKRYPFPAGGLFSTAEDVLKFGQMILNDGEWNGRKYLSTASIQEMTSKQTAPQITEEYGYGWSRGDGGVGHGGACKTQLRIFPQQGVAVSFMVQQQNEWMDDGEKMIPLVYEAAKNI